MSKTIYALTFCYEGCDDNYPFAQTIAVSDDVDKLREKMAECVKEDTREPNEENGEDEWCDEYNYQVNSASESYAILQHRVRTNLYCKYSIHSVEQL
jgi:hypothetical protein